MSSTDPTDRVSAPASDRATARLERWERRLFIGLVAAAIAPFWTTRWTPTMDGPIHLYVLEVMRSFVLDGVASPYRGAFELNAFVEPNLGFYLLGLPLSFVLPLPIVEKAVLSLAVAAFCLGGASLMRAAGGPRWAFAALLVPLSTHFFVHQGFHNSVVGIAVMLVALAFAVRHPPAWHARTLVAYTLVTLALVLVHLVALAAFGLAVGWHLVGSAIGRWIVDRRAGPAVRSLVASGTALASAALPALVLTASFLVRHDASTALAVDDSLRDRIAHVVWLTWLTGYSTLELAWLAPFVIVVGLLVLASGLALLRATAEVRARAAPALVVTLGLMLVVVFGFGNARDVGIGDRLTVVAATAALAFIAAVRPGIAARRIALALAVTVTLVNGAYRTVQYQRYDAALERYVALAHSAPEGSAVLGVRLDESSMALLDPSLERPTFPLLHAAALVAIDRQGVYLGATLLSRGRFGYFPIVYTPAVDPFPRIGTHETVPPRLDLDAYEADGGLRLDAVILIGHDDPTETLGYVRTAAPWADGFVLTASDARFRLHLLTRRD